MKIKSIELPYFNNHYNVRIETEGRYTFPERTNTIPLPDEDAIMYWGENDDGVVSFGIWMLDPIERPGHGGYWSSRESVVGPMIGQKLVSIGINHFAASMTVEALENILPEGYEVRTRKLFEGREDEETLYEVQRKDGIDAE